MNVRSSIRAIPVWIREALIMGAMGAVVFLIAGALERDAQRGAGGPMSGRDAPAFALPRVGDGGTVSLASLRGKPAIISFWATWCGACRAELPELETLWRGVGGRYHLLTVSAESPTTLRAFAKKNALTLPMLVDPDGRISSAYGVSQYPTTVIIDANGQISRAFSGAPHLDILEEHMQRLGAAAP